MNSNLYFFKLDKFFLRDRKKRGASPWLIIYEKYINAVKNSRLRGRRACLLKENVGSCHYLLKKTKLIIKCGWSLLKKYIKQWIVWLKTSW